MESQEELIETVICPHCNGCVVIKKVNCGIFRHGILKKNGKQIDPHASKKMCDRYVKKNLINGCGKPFKITLVDGKMQADVCDYI